MKKEQQGSVSTTSRQAAMGRTAAILVALGDNGFSGRALYRRAREYAATERSLPGRCA